MLLGFRLLGPVGVWADGRGVDLGPAESAKARCVLAVLLRTPGALVTTDALIERVWGERPPGAAVRYKYVGWLRSALAPFGVVLAHRDEGYVLGVAAEQVDLHRFRGLVAAGAQAQATGEPGRAAGLLDEALGLWQGPALAGLPGTWAEMFRDQLARERRDARAQWARCLLAAGRPGEAAPRLAEWETEYPLDEELIGLRMTALARSGQRAQALDCFERAVVRLRDALGSGPGPALRTVRATVFGPETLRRPETALRNPAIHLTARQLPAVTRHFTGRLAETAALDALLDEPSPTAGTAVIATIGGSAGIGKTALAVHWAHRVAPHFADGQLFVDLRGFAPGGPPMAAADAVRGFLDALEIAPHRIPAAPQAQAALYRSALAERRMLIVLDNARSSDQVRPLLPGASASLVVVTSRDLLTGLIATEGARPLALDLFSPQEARELLTRLLGGRQVAEEPEAARELITLCARQPLALSIAAARAATRPVRPLSALAAELGDTRRRLDVLRGEDSTTDLRAVFSWSYQTLSPSAARMFRLLGLHPGPEVTAPAAASLAASSLPETSAALDELLGAHLLAEPTAGRFACHDLLRAYAAEQARLRDPEAERREAVRRMLDHYLRTAHAAALRLRLHRPPITPPPALTGVRPEPIPDSARAMEWFEAEHAVLMAAVALAENHEFDTHACQLPWTMAIFLNRRGHWSDWEITQRTALAAAGRLRDRPEQALAHFGLGMALVRSDRRAQARPHFEQALKLYRGLGDRTGQAHTHSALARIHGEADRYEEALRHVERSLLLFEELGHLAGRARALTTVGWFHALLGDYESARHYGERSVAAHRELGDDCGQAEAWDTLGRTHQHRADHDRARICYQRSLCLYRELGDRYAEAELLVRLGDLAHGGGDRKAAHASWHQALAVLDELRHPDAAGVRARLDGTD